MTKGALFITGMTVKTEALLTCHQDSEWKKDRMNGLVGLLGSYSNGISDPFCPCKIGRCGFVISGISVNWGNPMMRFRRISSVNIRDWISRCGCVNISYAHCLNVPRRIRQQNVGSGSGHRLGGSHGSSRTTPRTIYTENSATHRTIELNLRAHQPDGNSIVFSSSPFLASRRTHLPSI